MLFFNSGIRFNVSVNMSGSGAVGLGVGVGSYQPGVYVPLKALFLVSDKCTVYIAAESSKMAAESSRMSFSNQHGKNDGFDS